MSKIKRKPILILLCIFLLSNFFSFGYLIFSLLRISNIENLLRLLISILLILILIYYLLTFIKLINNKKNNKKILIFSIVLLLTFIATGYVSVLIDKIYTSISTVSKDVYSYTTALISLNDKEYDVNNLTGIKIGIINKDVDKDAYETSYNAVNNKKIFKNELITYETNYELLEALYNKDVDAVFLPSSYVTLFMNNEKYADIENETKIIFTYEQEFKKEETKETTKKATDPVTFLLLGMDSTEGDISKVTSYNADTIMVVTFNPSNNKATLLSIPRDTYTPIMCFSNNMESKITHSGWQDVSCVQKTVENLLDIEIDYYAKINFTALVKLVDELGGIEVDVPFSFCEQDSQRRWEEYTVYVKEGLQTLNGEQALALSRNRHPNYYCTSEWTNYYSDDFIRGENQQKVLNALVNKVAKNIDLDTLYNLLDIVGDNVDTNMSVDNITSYYNVLKNMISSSDSIVKFERIKLRTYGKYLYDGALNMAGISMQIYYQDSLDAIKNEMKINLGLKDPDITKSFSFDANENYETSIIGDTANEAKTYDTLPRFIDEDLSVFESWVKTKSINYKIEYTENEEYANNIIVDQSIPYTYRLDKINSTLIITVNKLTEEKQDDDEENTNTEENNSANENTEEGNEDNTSNEDNSTEEGNNTNTNDNTNTNNEENNTNNEENNGNEGTE